MSHESIRYGITLFFYIIAYVSICIHLIFSCINFILNALISISEYHNRNETKLIRSSSYKGIFETHKNEFQKYSTVTIFHFLSLIIQVVAVSVFRSSSIIAIIVLIFVNIMCAILTCIACAISRD